MTQETQWDLNKVKEIEANNLKVIQNAAFCSNPIFIVAKDILAALHTTDIKGRTSTNAKIDLALSISQNFVQTYKEKFNV